MIYNVFNTPSHIALLAKVAHGDKVGTVEGFMTSICDIIVTLKTVDRLLLENVAQQLICY